MKEGVGKAKSTTAQKLIKEVEFRRSQVGFQHKHSAHSASMLERIKRRKSIEATGWQGDEKRKAEAPKLTEVVEHLEHQAASGRFETDIDVPNVRFKIGDEPKHCLGAIGSGPSAERLGQSNLKLKESEVVESGSGSSAERLGQPKKQNISRRSFEDEMQSNVKHQQEQCKRRRKESMTDNKPNSSLCHVEGKLQRDHADIRRGINGSICKREVNAISNLINARCDENNGKKLKHS